MDAVEKPIKRNTKKHALELVSWSLLLLLSLELFIRFFVVRSTMMVPNPVWGAVPVAGSCEFHALEGSGTTCYRANNEVDTPFHEGLPIVVLGDSYTKAIQVDNSEKYVSLAEVALRDRGFDVNLINLGESNQTIGDYVTIAPSVNSNYAPEIVVVQTNEAGLFDILNPNRVNYYEPQSDGSLELIHRDVPAWNIAFQNFIHSSGLLTFSAIRWEQTARAFPASKETVEPPRASLEQITAVIAHLKAAYPSSRIVMLVIPNVPIVPPNHTGLNWNNPQDKAILGVLSGIEDLTVIYPLPGFREIYKNYRAYPRGFINSSPNYGHLNRYGHVAVATALTDVLEVLLKSTDK